MVYSNMTIISYNTDTRNEYERNSPFFLKICSITVLSCHLAKYHHFIETDSLCERARLLKRLIVSKALETASSSVNRFSSPFFSGSVFRRPLVALLRFGRRTNERLSGHCRVVIIKVSLTRIRSARDNEAFDLKRPRGTRGKRERRWLDVEQKLDRREGGREGGGKPVVRESLLPARAMRVRAYICVRRYVGMEVMPTQEVTKKESVFTGQKELHSCRGRHACVYPLTSVFDWSVNILFRAESDLHM